MKKLLVLALLLSSRCFAIDANTVIINQVDPTGNFQISRLIAPPSSDALMLYNYNTNLPEWASYNGLSFTPSQIANSSAIGRDLLSAASASAARSIIGAGTSNFSGAWADLTGVRKTSDLINDSGFITSANSGVTSVNSLTGAVVVTPALIGAAPTTHSHTASQISDSTVTGRSLMTVADQSSAKLLLGVPTATSQLTNDTGFITSANLSNYATTAALTSGLATKLTAVKYTGTTNGSGVYAVTYPTAYATKPHIVFSVEGGTNKDTSVLQSTTTTGFSILVERRSDVVGLLPTYAVVSGLTVNVTVTQ